MKLTKFTTGLLLSVTILSTTTSLMPSQVVKASDYETDSKVMSAKNEGEKVVLNSQEKNNVAASTRALNDTADTSITTLMLKVRNTDSEKKTQFSYTPAVNSASPYDGGELTGYARVPLQGNVLNHSILPVNGGEHIKNWENGNYGARINVSFPKGVDAQAMFSTIDWDQSNQTPKDDFYIKAIGIPTPIHLTWGLKWDRNTVKFDPNNPNEFSIMLRGIKKSEVSTTEWNKYNPLITASALELVGAIPGGGILGNMDGWAEGMLKFDMSKYTGNKDDITKNKQLTKGRLFPDKSREAQFTISVLDQEALTAGTEGSGDIGKAIVKPGHEHDNPQTSNAVDTWDSYLSVWDREKKYNTNTTEENEVLNENGALPGESIFNRNITMEKGDNFNNFDKNRFDRVINYFTKQDVTQGKNGDIDSVEVSHNPSKIEDNKKTAVTYNGSVHYYNGQVRQLIPNVINVNNNVVPDTKGTITPNEYKLGERNITGTYTDDVAQARLFINGTQVSKGGTFTNGKFTYYVGEKTLSATDKVTMNAYDKDGNLLQENVPVVINQTPDTKGTITPSDYTVGNTNITGSYTGDVARARVTVNGVAQAWGGTFTNGQFNYYIGAGKIKAGDTVTITAYDKDSKILDTKPVTVKAQNTKGTITPSTYKVGDTDVTGSYTGDVAKARLAINGKMQAWGGDFTNGQFDYYIGAGKIKSGDKVTITAYDKDGKVLDQDKKVTVEGDESKGTIKANKYTIGDTQITGTYTGKVAKAQISINGKVQAYGGDFTNGQFKYYVGAGKIKAGDTVTITAYDADDKVLDKDEPVTIAEAAGTLTPDTYYLGQTTVKGSYTGNIVRARLLINGTAQAWGGTFSDGSFSYYIGSGKIKKGDTVRIAGYDSNDNEVTTVPVNVTE
ncbi:immunoglobulin-like domain-containing protein [Latilactobacillus fragifolii]|uniref:immunoglobulin-like domain-containing protein n=1 Tax=Latilactobacillus fragifolii TaxID=2814244 RepID=UPI001ABB64DD|nr:immunoglobulin-like domain-containing protein [Latilactobacillus fragifolii]